MKRSHFVKLCLLTGVAGSAGLATQKDELPGDLHVALKDAGLELRNARGDGKALQLSGQIADYPTFSRKAAALGDGKVVVKWNTLFFEREGRRMELQLIA
jgi:hypothetical protein